MKHIAALALIARACAPDNALHRIRHATPAPEPPPFRGAVQPIDDEGDATARRAELPPPQQPAGVCRASFKDALPPAPAPLDTPSTLAPGDGALHATCAAVLDNGSLATDPSTSEMVGSVGHAGGAFYYEAVVEEFTAGWSAVGVNAFPYSVFDGAFVTSGDPFNSVAVSAAALSPSGLGSVVGVAADLDAGVVTFYEDGRVARTAPLSLLPGVGAYTPAITSMIGNRIHVNLGGSPFRFAVPAGFRAWASDLADDGAGACVSDDAPAFDHAPITATCGEGPVTTFQSSCDGDVVALGIYTTSSANSDHSEGTTLVHVTRHGHVTLGLSAYEPTHWIVDAADGAVVDAVFVYGFLPARVDAPDGAVVTNGTNLVGGFEWPFDDGGDDTQGYVDTLEKDAGAPLAMFGGCYAGTEFTVGD